jgi:type II secretory pathway pseudopilin PulG
MQAEKGFTMVEVLISITLLSVVGIAILSGLVTIFKSESVSGTQTAGMSVAQSQLEFVKNEVFNLDATDKVGYYNITSIPSGYTVWTVPRGANADGTGQPVQCTTGPKGGLIGIPWDSQPGSGHDKALTPSGSSDKNIQKITAIINKDGRTLITLSTFRVQP